MVFKHEQGSHTLKEMIFIFIQKQKDNRQVEEICSLKDGNEIRRTDIEDLKEVAEKFLTELYTEENTDKRQQDEILSKIETKLDGQQRIE